MFEDDDDWDQLIGGIANEEEEFNEQMKSNSVLPPECSCKAIKLESTPCPVHDLNIFYCPSCKYQIDPDYCWCGEGKENHGYRDGHSFIPIGCQCGFAKGE